MPGGVETSPHGKSLRQMLWVPALLSRWTWLGSPGPDPTLTATNDYVGLFLSPQIPDKVHMAQHISGSKDEQDWTGKILGPDDLGPG